MNFYVASGVENAARVNEAALVLQQNGHRRTYDWTTHGSVRDAAASQKATVALSESTGVAAADLTVLLLPGAKGTHAELGMAIAAATAAKDAGKEAKRILIWSESSAPFDGTEGFCVFYFHPCVERIVCPFPALLERLRTF